MPVLGILSQYYYYFIDTGLLFYARSKINVLINYIIIIIIIISTREVAPSAKAGINGEPQIQVTVNDNRLKIGK